MELPKDFICGITQDVMRDPVTTAAGQTYDRAGIEAWFAVGHRHDPITGKGLPSTALTRNSELRGAIEAFLDDNKALAEKLGHLESLRRKAEAQPDAELQRFLDPITFRIMREPVRAEDGCVYDRASIARWIAESAAAGRPVMSPSTGQPMGTTLTAESELQRDMEALWSAMSTSKAAQEPEEAGDQQVASVHELCRIFSVLDQVQDVLKESLGEWEPPRIVVLGAENSGKSTLLERLCLLPLFPHDRKICTRTAVRVSIRRFTVQLEPTLEVWDAAKKQRVGNIRTLPLVSSESAIKEEMGRIMQEGTGAGVSVDRELHISLVSPHLPPMNLVDLPGLVENAPATKEQTRQLAEKYIADHTDGSLFLVVMSAESSPNTSPVMAMIKDKGLEARAVGVFTKCDKLSDEDEDFDRLHELLLGIGEDTVKMEPHGYVATSNKKAAGKGTEGTATALLQQARHEVQFFREKGFEGDIHAGRATTQGLTNKITAMYTDYVRATWLPAALSRLRKEVRACQEADRNLGLPAAPGDLNGESLKELQEAAVSAAQAAAESWLESFSRRLKKEVLGPLQAELTAVLNKAGKAIPVGREFRTLQEVRQKAEALCMEAVAKLEALLDPHPEDPFANDLSTFRLQRFPGLTAKLHEVLKAAVRQWDTLAESVTDFLKKSMHPTTAPDLQVSYTVAQEPCTVDIVLPAARIANAVLFMVGESVSDVTAQAMQDTVRGICMECLAAAGQEVEACHGERKQLQRRQEDLKEAMQHLWQLKVGGNGQGQPAAASAAVQALVTEYLAQEEAGPAEEALPAVQDAAPAAVEAAPAEETLPAEAAPQAEAAAPAEEALAAVKGALAAVAEEEEVAAAVRAAAAARAVAQGTARSYSSCAGGCWGDSRLGSRTCWIPGPGNAARPGAEWVQLDLGRVCSIAGVVTRGYEDCWVTQYDVHVSADGTAFQRAGGGPFQGSVRGYELATVRFPAVVEARYVRISPVSWHIAPFLRCDVLVET